MIGKLLPQGIERLPRLAQRREDIHKRLLSRVQPLLGLRLQRWVLNLLDGRAAFAFSFISFVFLSSFL